MAGRVEMGSGVLVLGRIAAPNVPADQANSEMDPGIAHGETFLAPVWRAWRDILDLIEVSASLAHGWFPFRECYPDMFLPQNKRIARSGVARSAGTHCPCCGSEPFGDAQGQIDDQRQGGDGDRSS
jgi:hypothetical protein